MLLPALLALLAAAPDSGAVHNGRRGETRVAPPRVEAEIVVDGVLDEPVWRRAAVLTGFSSYSPVDGKPAEDSTEVLVWYSATAIHFGVRAFEAHGAVHATHADRDRIDSDDYVQLLLDTFDDRRRAYVFAANPLGVQADGIRGEGSSRPFTRNQSFGANTGVGSVDLSPDFLYESRGQLTSDGYAIEMRVPFKSLRYQGARTQRWGVQVIRQVQHSGHQQTWTPARLASASFLAQSGTLEGLSDLHRGLVLELVPEARTRIDGDSAAGGGWRYRTDPELGGNVRWGMLPNLGLNATIRPDFSQVEADATQIASDVRFALFYPEKRPFFLDGIEQFETPNSLVYTRTIVQPDVAAKETGKIGSVNVAALSALDERAASLTGGHRPVFNIVRLRRDIGTGSTVGLTYTDRLDGPRVNHMASADARVVFGRLYYAQLQAAGSATRTGAAGGTVSAPFWEAVVDRTGRRFGFHYSLTGIHPDFVADAGFVPRTDFVRPSLSNRLRWYAPRGSRVETYTVFASAQGTWLYDDFFAGRRVLEQRYSVDNSVVLRGGWSLGLLPVVESYAFDARRYAAYQVALGGPGGDLRPFAVSPRTTTYYVVGRLQTPQYPRFAAQLNTQLGRDVDFLETAPAHRADVTATVDLRPTSRLRLSGSYGRSAFRRWRDDSKLSTVTIPRLKAEYQLTRAAFVRFVGQYDARDRDALYDPRTGDPIVTLRDSVLTPLAASSSNGLRVDWLFSYRPNPGTVLFAGYGSSLAEPDAFRFRELTRSTDGFFLKASYLFRL